MNNRKRAKLEKRVAARAVAALNAVHQRVAASGFPQTVVTGDGLYRVSASGAKELLRMLAPRASAPGRAKRTKL